MSLPPVPDGFSDRKYGSKHGVDLWLRVYPAQGYTTPRPWLLWMHGGAFCSGQHYHVRVWLYPLLQSLGIHLVSTAYRLGPVASVDDQLDDCEDAYQYCRGLDMLGEKFAIGGDSSGGALALLLGLRIPASVVINVYGVSDLPIQQALYDSQPESGEWSGTMSEEEVQRECADRDLSHAITTSKNFWNLASLPHDLRNADHDTTARALRKIWKVSDAEWNPTHRASEQWDIKGYITHTKSMVSLAYRIDSALPPEEKMDKMKAYTLRHFVKQYPPTVILHGTGDRAVPVEASYELAKHLRSIGEVKEIYPPGEDHGWDNIYTAPDVPGWNEYIAPIGEFLAKHLEPEL